MEQYLIDTNVVSDFLSDSFSPAARQLMDLAIDNIPNISIITQIELRCWKNDPETELKVKNLIADCVIFDIKNEVIEQCVKIRKGQKIKLPDAIIAATALVYDLTLITHNTKDFSSIQGLKTIDPHKL
jgi:hypothetical protein